MTCSADEFQPGRATAKWLGTEFPSLLCSEDASGALGGRESEGCWVSLSVFPPTWETTILQSFPCTRYRRSLLKISELTLQPIRLWLLLLPIIRDSLRLGDITLPWETMLIVCRIIGGTTITLFFWPWGLYWKYISALLKRRQIHTPGKWQAWLAFYKPINSQQLRFDPQLCGWPPTHKYHVTDRDLHIFKALYFGFLCLSIFFPAFY